MLHGKKPGDDLLVLEPPNCLVLKLCTRRTACPEVISSGFSPCSQRGCSQQLQERPAKAGLSIFVFVNYTVCTKAFSIFVFVFHFCICKAFLYLYICIFVFVNMISYYVPPAHSKYFLYYETAEDHSEDHYWKIFFHTFHLRQHKRKFHFHILSILN